MNSLFNVDQKKNLPEFYLRAYNYAGEENFNLRFRRFYRKPFGKIFLLQGYQVIGCDLFETSVNGDAHVYIKVSRLSPEWETLFTIYQPDICINAAGSGNVPYSIEHPLSDFEANTLDTARLLDFIRRLLPRCKYLHISSAAVYGNPPSLPVTEDMPLHPLSPYGWHKLMSEMLCHEFHKLYGLQVAIVRPFSVYGRGLRKQLLWDVCKKMQDQEIVALFGTGRESRDFIHIDDLCVLLDCMVCKCGFKADIYNAGNGVQVPIRDIVFLLKNNFESRKLIHFNGESRKGDPLNWEADTSKTAKLGYLPKVSLKTGVADYVSYFKELRIK